ncbi:hypothetical protein HYPBUDRAFT_11167 [Hyphopichia burtonii NRRL Y-1933]|uniref:MFS general substrate transporter n=1 Tax=Hyphopichia burtonii NRRL Y-1933 TaxID=984485 RepID=A0A1E4RL82_9ASCO|nr:hypothetical protein HYPBUDRAFT_11167 [Hyphopichia burtonii NRRL Y-1933]ODV68022.1 hypothetical protein HYPBUDRAFT_11167 [Hyphopichia burtonii NRRL Y-1933]
MFMPLGIFLFGWTSKASIHWFPSMLGAACFGFSAYMGFQTLMSYLSHSFKRYVASVMAANNFFRSLIGGLICLSAHPLYNNLSANSPNYPVGWGSTILGFIAILLSLIPLIFYFNGPKLRARSKFAN